MSDYVSHIQFLSNLETEAITELARLHVGMVVSILSQTVVYLV